MAKQHEEEEVILLDFWSSMFGMRVRIALAEKGISYEYKEQDLINKSQLLLETNPVHKKVPVLIHNDKLSVEYIDDVWNDKAPLFPDDAYAKAHAKFWVELIDKKLYQSGRNLYTTKGYEQEASRKEFIDCLKFLEGELGDKTYFGGEMFSHLDLSLIPFHSWFQVYETFGNLNLEHECPKLIAWAKRCVENKESVYNTLPDMLKVFGLAQSWRKRFGLEE